MIAKMESPAKRDSGFDLKHHSRADEFLRLAQLKRQASAFLS
jgi:hypothetical protein